MAMLVHGSVITRVADFCCFVSPPEGDQSDVPNEVPTAEPQKCGDAFGSQQGGAFFL